MTLDRREMLTACAAAVPALALAGEKAGQARPGVVSYSYHLRLDADRAAGKPGLNDPLSFLEYCHQLGAGGVQLGLGLRDAAYLASLREKVESWGMFLEGSIRLPRDRADAERFAAEVAAFKDAGANVLRTVMLSSRRYETFDTAAAFRQWAQQAWHSVVLAEPVVARNGLRLAVENHKDHRSGDLADLLKRLASPHVGACVDTGNNIALLEDPLEVIQTLAPWAYSVHLKDMAVEEYGEGFLLSEVPFGEGVLDLKKVVALLRRARPEVRFNVEMITRDPLRVPCLTPKYWATFEDLPGRHLARTLTWVRRNKPAQPLPRVRGMSPEQQLAEEDKNVRKCLAYAGKQLEM
jgi:sugar phosphate isomerase/epimerase